MSAIHDERTEDNETTKTENTCVSLVDTGNMAGGRMLRYTQKRKTGAQPLRRTGQLPGPEYPSKTGSTHRKVFTNISKSSRRAVPEVAPAFIICLFFSMFDVRGVARR